MRRAVREAGRYAQARGLGAPSPACGFNASSLDNSTVAGLTANCVQAGIAAAGEAVENKIANAWGSFLNDVGVAVTSGATTSATFAADAVIVNQVAAFIVNEAADSNPIVAALALDIADILAEELGIEIADVAISTSSAGLIGFVIGVLIAGITILADALNPHTVQTTFGATTAGNVYIQTTIPAAAAVLSAPPGGTLAGITVRWFAKRYALFLANPVWLWANQALTGMCQPLPPNDLGGGDQVDIIFTQLPGAFEMLSKAQFIEASAVVASSPLQLPFFMSDTPGPAGATTPFGPDVYPDPNPCHYEAFIAPVSDWMPDEFIGAAPSIANPAFPFTSPWTGSPGPNVTTVTSTCPASSVPNAPMGSGANASLPYNYAACPNLWVDSSGATGNDNTTDSAGNITGQTNVGKGILIMQAIWPALTATQCLQIAAQNHAGYLKAAAAASVAPVLVAGAPAAAAKSSSTFGGTVAKGLGAALGLGAIALGAYSLTKGIPVARAADMAYAKTRSVASREIRRLR